MLENCMTNAKNASRRSKCALCYNMIKYLKKLDPEALKVGPTFDKLRDYAKINHKTWCYLK